MNCLFDFWVGWNVGSAQTKLNRSAEMATWTEEMKQAHWAEWARREAVIAQQRPLKFILLAILGLIALAGGYAHG